MALTKEQVEKAKNILKEIGDLDDTFSCEYNDEFPAKTGIIFIKDLKWDGGCNAIIINIRDISAHQMKQFQEKQDEVCNSIIFTKIDSEEKNITRIGWYI
jgi:glutathionylspermidine synthase